MFICRQTINLSKPPLLRGAKNSNRWLMWMRGDKGGPENSQLPHTHTHTE